MHAQSPYSEPSKQATIPENSNEMHYSPKKRKIQNRLTFTASIPLSSSRTSHLLSSPLILVTNTSHTKTQTPTPHTHNPPGNHHSSNSLHALSLSRSLSLALSLSLSLTPSLYARSDGTIPEKQSVTCIRSITEFTPRSSAIKHKHTHTHTLESFST
ncbi:hypothetical protein M758_12G083900 [Ceratodon purpureus]|nr:hypothetical protein M758_12G083900 [Ceratodon purpureus]